MKDRGNVQMPPSSHDEDIRAIDALIKSQFRSLDWTPERPADWSTFAGAFFPGATLIAAARPAKRQTVEAFVERMKGLARSTLPRFEESPYPL